MNSSLRIEIFMINYIRDWFYIRRILKILNLVNRYTRYDHILLDLNYGYLKYSGQNLIGVLGALRRRGYNAELSHESDNVYGAYWIKITRFNLNKSGVN